MTKSEIVKEISARTGIDSKAVLAVVEGFMTEVKTSLGKEENVYLRGFGSFIVKKRAQKTARNISKNTTMIIPAHNIPVFKPSEEFLTMVKWVNNERSVTAIERLEAAKEIYRKHGCPEEFLFDWQLLINEVKAYQLESPATVKLPKLSPTEMELVREEMNKR